MFVAKMSAVFQLIIIIRCGSHSTSVLTIGGELKSPGQFQYEKTMHAGEMHTSCATHIMKRSPSNVTCVYYAFLTTAI